MQYVDVMFPHRTQRPPRRGTQNAWQPRILRGDHNIVIQPHERFGIVLRIWLQERMGCQTPARQADELADVRAGSYGPNGNGLLDEKHAGPAFEAFARYERGRACVQRTY